MFFRFMETSYSKFNQSAKLYLSAYPDSNELSQNQYSEKSFQQGSSFLTSLSPSTDGAPSSTPMITTGNSTTVADDQELVRSRSLSIDLLNQPQSFLQIRYDNKTTVFVDSKTIYG